MLAVKYY